MLALTAAALWTLTAPLERFRAGARRTADDGLLSLVSRSADQQTADARDRRNRHRDEPRNLPMSTSGDRDK